MSTIEEGVAPEWAEPRQVPAFSHLFTMQARLAVSLDAGEGPLGRRVLNAVSGGEFYGRV